MPQGESEAPDQLDMGFEQIHTDTQVIEIDKIRGWEDAELDSGLVKAMRAIGFKSAVEVRLMRDFSYQIVAGRRRLRAAKECGITSVAAVVYTDAGDAETALATVTENVVRRDNPVDNGRKILQLIQKGYTADSLAKVGIPKNTTNRYMRLMAAPQEVIEAVEHGKVAVTTAQKIANMGPEEQTEAVRILGEKHTLTAQDVKEIRMVREKSKVASLPTEMFAEPVQSDPREGQRQALRSAVRSALASGISKAEITRLVKQSEA